MQADDVLRPLREPGDYIEIQSRGVGRENRAWFDDLVEPLEHLPLDLEILEHGLDHQVHVAQRLVLQGRRDQRQAPFEARLGKRPLAQRALVMAADVDEASVHVDV